MIINSPRSDVNRRDQANLKLRTPYYREPLTSLFSEIIWFLYIDDINHFFSRLKIFCMSSVDFHHLYKKTT